MKCVRNAAMAGWLICRAAFAATTVTVTPHEDRPGPPIPADYLGISVETASIVPYDNGTRRFTPDNLPLLNLYRTLGVASLRLGGNQVDFATSPIPSHADIDPLFAFAKAAGLKVIYSFRLMPTPEGHDQDPHDAAATAKYIADRYGNLVDSFEIGNEPNLWPKPNKVTYAQFYPKWARAAEAIIAAVPNAKLSGPGSAGLPGWFLDFARDAKKQFPNSFFQGNQHHYFGGGGKAIKSPTTARARLLSQDILADYQAKCDQFAPAVRKLGLGYRLEETNSLSRGGALQVSNTQTAALWAVRYLYWWADHDCQGINFHTGDWVIAKPGDPAGNPYAVYWSTPEHNGYVAQPLAYAMKAFDLGCHGRRVPTTTSGDASDLAAYAVAGDGRVLSVTLINTADQEITARLPAAGRSSADAYWLLAPNNDPAAEAGLTLGGAPITNDGRWAGHATPLPAPAGGTFSVTLPPASVAVVTLRP